ERAAAGITRGSAMTVQASGCKRFRPFLLTRKQCLLTEGFIASYFVSAWKATALCRASFAWAATSPLAQGRGSKLVVWNGVLKAASGLALHAGSQAAGLGYTR